MGLSGTMTTRSELLEYVDSPDRRLYFFWLDLRLLPDPNSKTNSGLM